MELDIEVFLGVKIQLNIRTLQIFFLIVGLSCEAGLPVVH